MSDDAETARQIAELAMDDRPLLVIDVDDVILEFLRPFMRYLKTHGLELSLETFGFSENIRRMDTGEQVDRATIDDLISTFFETQHDWQQPLPGAPDTIARLSESVEVVLLTAMPHCFRERRRVLLDSLGVCYPLLTTEKAKGPALVALRGENGRPVAFVDDLPHNHVSARATLPDAHLFHFMALPELAPILPPVPDGVVHVEAWRLAGPQIAQALGVEF